MKRVTSKSDARRPEMTTASRRVRTVRTADVTVDRIGNLMDYELADLLANNAQQAK
jgi:hypothetical protein